ncbi:MAG: tetratricopeptide repeat protein [Planctomycetes bacterium]|nr:tetratricopeptide repeat protein [Planctomycetota bacterium]
MLAPYDPCPCGSGKKFKWCCQPIHVEIDKAFRQDAEGQHEAALRTMERLTTEHADNPEAWGRKAELLYNLEKVEEAEAALQKAFDVNPKYPFGHFLKGSFRLHEGEVAGALMLYRKAADLYDPQAGPILAQLYTAIFDCEMRLNHPLAARAAAALSIRFHPNDAQLRETIEAVFGPNNPNVPKSAKPEYKFMPIAAGVTPERRQAWETALASAGSGKLSDATRAFEQLTQDDPNDAPAWYNLGLVQAWLGANAPALEAFDRYVDLEGDEERAGAAWTLGEILRCGQGTVDEADYLQHSRGMAVLEPQRFAQAVNELQKDGTLAGLQLNEERTVLQGMVLLPPPPALTPELEAKQSRRLGAFFLFLNNILHLWNTREDAVDIALESLRPHLGQISQVSRIRGPVKFNDVFSEALLFPPPGVSKEEFEKRLAESFTKFVEETWLQRPLKSLGNVPPIDAAGQAGLRKKLRGVIQFMEEVAAIAQFPYDFGRLRRKLNLGGGADAAVGAEATSGKEATPDIAAMGATELLGLNVDELAEAQLEEAFQAAMKLDARDLAGKFARTLVAKPTRAERPDRLVFYNHLVQLALAEGNTTAALDLINDGEKDDCEHNAGKRRNDYELRRAQIHVKAGQIAEGQDVFDRLIARLPDELKYRGSAAEAMLSARESRRALHFAEQGLEGARKQSNRDSEQYFLELAAAARKQGA